MQRANEEVFTIRDNVADPTGQSDARGTELAFNMQGNILARPKFRWHDRIAEVDVYAAGEGSLMMHFYCPKCAQALRVTSEQKEIRFEPSGGGGRLSISAFRCTWESCGLHIRIENNVAIDVT